MAGSDACTRRATAVDRRGPADRALTRRAVRRDDRGDAHAAGGDPAGHDVPDGRLHGARGRSDASSASRRCRSSSRRSAATIEDHPLLNARVGASDAIELRGQGQRRDRGRHRARARRAGRAGRRAARRSPSSPPRSRGCAEARAGTATLADRRPRRRATIAVSNTGLVRERGGHADPVAGHRGDAGVRRDRAPRARRGRRGGRPAGRHALPHVRPPRARRRRGGPRPDRPGRAARVGRTPGGTCLDEDRVAAAVRHRDRVRARARRRPRGRDRRVRLPGRRRSPSP